jgi:hypothetical protein
VETIYKEEEEEKEKKGEGEGRRQIEKMAGVEIGVENSCKAIGHDRTI